MTDHDFPREYVALDLETTGFYPDSCRITEIGAVRVSDGAIVSRFQQLVNPLKPIPAQVTRLTGISDAMVADQPPLDEALPAFLAWLAAPAGALPVVGHNVGFDIRFLDHASRRVAGVPFACVDYDTMQISRALFPTQKRHRLVDLIQRFGIADTEEHRALSDAIQTHQCLEWMRGWVLDRSGLFADGFRFVPTPATDGTEALHQRLVCD
ncbi:3'-5' exonuclease [Bifidobacterium pullorum subsp. saeculare]|uniref:3'-5' exonuclease n=1 Tax=Bifidobacterium pullorum subsp. saeculare TaxID=78257 RepID=A0A938WVR4_9BIFI|nr:3'-5' exonuclease [Bifidobacterium pullorum]MBM6699715.1 3'-5' exonuclease [Bifidobacterium pullorum subsp. saeculare]